MCDFTSFKKAFCDCCDTKRYCKLSPIKCDKNFIDWEEFSKSLGTNKKRCDAVYIQADNKVCFIEHKNIKWFDNKTEKSLATELLEKYHNSEKKFKSECTLKDPKSYFFCSYNLNNITNDISVEGLVRQIRNQFYNYFLNEGIFCEDCQNVAYMILYNAF